MTDTARDESRLPAMEKIAPDPEARSPVRRRNPGRRRLLALAGAAAIGTAGVAAAGCSAASASTASAPSCSQDSPKLTVQGTGLATGSPDTLTVDINISTTGATAQAALADNNAKASAVVTALTAAGITKENVQTTGLSVQPNYTFTHGNEVLSGYGVNNTVSAVITNLASAGSVIDTVSGAAGNAGQINSVSYSIKDTRDLQDRARTDAVHQAVSHAQTMAASAGERLGPVCSLTDTTPIAPGGSGLNAATGTTPSSGVPLEAGSQQASAQVTIVYLLKG